MVMKKLMVVKVMVMVKWVINGLPVPSLSDDYESMIRIMLIKGAPSREAWDFHKRDRQQKPSGDFHHNLNQNDKIKITKRQYSISNPIQKGSTDGRGVNELESSRGSPRYQASDKKMVMMIFELKSGIKHNIGGAINAVILLLFKLKI